MTITRITSSGGRVIRQVLVDTDRPKYRFKDIFKRIDEANEVIDSRVERLSVRLCDLIG
jgi:hypothetical protein